MESILFSTPILMVICLVAALLHVLEFMFGGSYVTMVFLLMFVFALLFMLIRR